MFKKQFKISKRETKKWEEICQFSVSIYVKHCFTASDSASAPQNDLTIVKELHNYKKINKGIANAAINKFKNHLWYLSEELVVLGFFDDNISIDAKEKMRTALKKSSEPEPPKKFPSMKKLAAIKTFGTLSLKTQLIFLKYLDGHLNF